MRPLSLAFTATLLLASSAGAQNGNYPATDKASTSTVQVTAPAREFVLYDYQTEWISGAYALSNGWRMKVEPARDGISAQIDKQRPIKLIALSEDKFVSPDGNVSMEFNRGQAGDEMLMSYVPAGASLAQAIVVTATLAQR